ncbi:hypothetical protein FRC06_002867 [Ceratobasidium sp. 370]|nr:hypothetical protein FRC06_002867 [Ceratobasidium sp. 370]
MILSRRSGWFAILLAILVSFFMLALEFGTTPIRQEICQAVYSNTRSSPTVTNYLAPYANGSTLIAEILAMREGRQVPVAIASSKIIHQHWGAHGVPAIYHPLMASWQSTYPDWVHVLWDENDNLKLVETFFPEWRNAYNALPSGIYRADFARNLYMYVFGGIYADLNSEALLPLKPILAAQGSPSTDSAPIAFLGMMDTATAHFHSIPTAFMASSAPGHPLWLISAQDAVDWSRARSWSRNIPGPEYVTGPVALRRSIMAYSPLSLELAPVSPEDPLTPNTFNSTTAPVMVFSPDTIYPLTWDRRRPHVRTAAQECLCWISMPTFNSAACKKMSGAHWVINYWEH